MRPGCAIRSPKATRPSPKTTALRSAIGINFGEVIEEEGDVFGDGVNIAARVGALAKPGSVYMSETVHDKIAGEIDLDFEDLGPQDLKNISRPIRVYRILGDMAGLSEDLVAAAAKFTASPPAFDDRRAIAVLPFANFSGDPEQEFFADGITEDIISMLAGWRAFSVIARASTFTYKGKAVDIKKVGQELGVSYVVEGSVRKSGRRVRVTIQLIQADTNHHIMAERYDRDLTDLFELQDEIAHTITGAMEPELLKFERERIAERPHAAKTPTNSTSAACSTITGKTRRTTARHGLTSDERLADRPAIPAGRGGAVDLAAVRGLISVGPTIPSKTYEESFELGQRAVMLDPRYPIAHFALALICMWTGRSDRVVPEFQEAIKLNPSYAAAHAVLGAVLNSYEGKSEKAIRRRESNSPQPERSAVVHLACRLGSRHYQLRQYSQEAVEIGRRSWSLNRSYYGV